MVNVLRLTQMLEVLKQCRTYDEFAGRATVLVAEYADTRQRANSDESVQSRLIAVLHVRLAVYELCFDMFCRNGMSADDRIELLAKTRETIGLAQQVIRNCRELQEQDVSDPLEEPRFNADSRRTLSLCEAMLVQSREHEQALVRMGRET